MYLTRATRILRVLSATTSTCLAARTSPCMASTTSTAFILVSSFSSCCEWIVVTIMDQCLESQQWEKLNPLGVPPTRRYYHACAAVNTDIYIFGGYDGSPRVSDVHRYDTGMIFNNLNQTRWRVCVVVRSRSVCHHVVDFWNLARIWL